MYFCNWGGLYFKRHLGTSLGAQWERVCLPMQETQVWSLIQEDPTGLGETKPVCHKYSACALESLSHNYWAHMLCALQWEKPPQWEAHPLQLESSPHLLQLEKSLCTNTDPEHACGGYSLIAVGGLLIVVASLIMGMGSRVLKEKPVCQWSQHSQKINKQIKIPKIKKRNLERRWCKTQENELIMVQFQGFIQCNGLNVHVPPKVLCW